MKNGKGLSQTELTEFTEFSSASPENPLLINEKVKTYDLAGKIIGLAMKIHRTLGPGFLESVYHNALEYELQKGGHKTVVQHSIQVRYDGVAVGNFIADLVIDDSLLVEIKAVEKLHPNHEVQVVNYLTATGLDEGLLLNFGGYSLEFQKKYPRKRKS